MTFDYLAERGLVDSDYDGQYVWFRVNSRGIRALEKAIGEEIVISEEEE
jgi:DNA-binding transcriptional ArsR family regulator